MNDSHMEGPMTFLAVRRSRRSLLRTARYGVAWIPPGALLLQAQSCGASVEIDQCPGELRVGEVAPVHVRVRGSTSQSGAGGSWTFSGAAGAVTVIDPERGGRERPGPYWSGNPIWLRANAPGMVTVTYGEIFQTIVLIIPYFARLSDSCTIRILPAESTPTPEPAEPAAVGPVRFVDHDFDDVNWEATVDATGGATQEAGQKDGYRRMIHRLPGTGEIVVRHVFIAAGYGPARQGAIDRIDYAEDRVVFDPPYHGAGVGAAALLEQDGEFYVALAGSGEAVNSEWQRVSARALRAEDFRQADGSHPDFSANGGPIRFGYQRSNRATTADGLTIEHGIDDWVVAVHPSAT